MLRIAILGCSGHWRLAAEGVSAGRADIEWVCAPVASTGAVASMGDAVAPTSDAVQSMGDASGSMRDALGLTSDALGRAAAQGIGKDSPAADGGPAMALEPEDMAPVLVALKQSGAAQVELDPDWRHALDHFHPDIAVVNPPFHLQAVVILECLRRGIHVFAEKPMALTKADLDRMRAALRDPRAPKLMAMLTMRYEPGILAARKFLASGALGTPLLISVEKSYPLIGWDGKSRPAFYRRRATYGGTIPWIGIHALDLIRWFSQSEFRRVEAWHSASGQGGMGEMETSAAMRFKLERGATAVVKLDFQKSAPTARWGDDTLRVACELGFLEVHNGRARAQIGEGETRELPPVEGLDMFADFLAWVETDAPMLLDTRDCVLAAEAALLSRDAADQNRAIAF